MSLSAETATRTRCGPHPQHTREMEYLFASTALRVACTLFQHLETHDTLVVVIFLRKVPVGIVRRRVTVDQHWYTTYKNSQQITTRDTFFIVVYYTHGRRTHVFVEFADTRGTLRRIRHFKTIHDDVFVTFGTYLVRPLRRGPLFKDEATHHVVRDVVRVLAHLFVRRITPHGARLVSIPIAGVHDGPRVLRHSKRDGGSSVE